MDSIHLHHHNTENNIDELKFAALYFDKVNVNIVKLNWYVTPTENNRFILYHPQIATQEYLNHIKPLIDAGIVVNEEIYRKELFESLDGFVQHDSVPNGADKIVLDNFEKIYKTHTKVKQQLPNGGFVYTYDGDLIDELKDFERRLGKLANTEAFIIKYLISRLVAILQSFSNGQPVLNTSPLVDEYIKQFLASSEFNTAKSTFNNYKSVEAAAAFESLRFNMPNISSLPIDEIIWIREKLAPELLAFRYEMRNLAADVAGNFGLTRNSEQLNEIVNAKIQPRLRDLEAKIKSLDNKFLIEILSEIKDPKSYSPLLLSFFSNISSVLMIMLSLGAMSLKSALTYYDESVKVKQDGLYYLLRMRRK